MNNIVLVGFMGSGKSTVGLLLAERLGRPFRDLDDEIVSAAGHPVDAIFATEGESGFRRRETDSLARVLERDGQVVAVGGGAPLDDENWRRMREGNCVVALTADPAVLASRLDGSSQRPLLEPDAPTAIATLLPRRLDRYREADLVVETDGRSAAAVAAELTSRVPTDGLERVPVPIPGSSYEVVIGRRLGHLMAPALRRAGAAGAVLLVTDSRVGAAHAGPLLEGLRAAGFDTHAHRLSPGEAAKGIETLSHLYERLADLRLDRRGALVALGGGVVGDVTGFAAATWLRGVRYLQVPTTLLAMVDSSIGGKTAINLRSGKNLVGAVHQPSAIFCDLDYLATLPDEEYRSGMAEVLKAAIIADREFVEWLVASAALLQGRDPAALRQAVRRAIAIKVAVVAQDPAEEGRRAILNYGHTVGHALERALGYGTIRHGEAVAWGMEVAAELSASTGRCSADVVSSQRSLLQAFGLLEQRPKIPRTDLLEAIAHDKKSRAGEIGWVLLRGVGNAEWGRRVDPEQLSAALDKVFAV